MINYVVISPVRDEEQYIEYTIKSMISQTIKPSVWVIVNDGSRDNTERIIAEYARTFSWIQVNSRIDRGWRERGAGVVEAFDLGMKCVGSSRYDFIVKLDGDLSFDEYYFEKIFAKFSEDPKLGIAGGVCYEKKGRRLVIDRHPMFHVRGATKVYRAQCFREIGGLTAVLGWDTIDEIRANMLGWTTRSFPDIGIIHHRRTGATSKFMQVDSGKGCYFLGYHPAFILLKAIKWVPRKPFLIGAVAFLYGYIRAYISNFPKIDDREFVEYLRKQQRNRLLFRETIWK
jgi:glycosyltransferase involved in cell wall biosynthesis